VDGARAADLGAADAPERSEALGALNAEVVACRRCPRLVEWRERTAREKVARYRDEPYWGKPVPSFGDPAARILIVGLAPAAHGGNRTGRMFTGDRSGDFLYRALHENGLSSSAISHRRDDGLTLTGVRISAIVHCAPPANKPTTDERDACLPYLGRELALLPDVRVILALGAFGWDGVLRALAGFGQAIPRPRPRFRHGAEARIGPYLVLGSFHPSQQNTFTGRLTPEMLRTVLARALDLAGLQRA
jgi:uracil-DNA glycosylase